MIGRCDSDENRHFELGKVGLYEPDIFGWDDVDENRHFQILNMGLQGSSALVGAMLMKTVIY